MDKAGIIGVDIGGTNFRIGTVHADETVSRFCKIPVGEVFCTDDPLADLGDYLNHYIQDSIPDDSGSPTGKEIRGTF